MNYYKHDLQNMSGMHHAYITQVKGRIVEGHRPSIVMSSYRHIIGKTSVREKVYGSVTNVILLHYTFAFCF